MPEAVSNNYRSLQTEKTFEINFTFSTSRKVLENPVLLICGSLTSIVTHFQPYQNYSHY